MTLSIILPLLLLALLVLYGTREGSDWKRSLYNQSASLGMDERLSSFSGDGALPVTAFKGKWARHGLVLAPGEEGYASFVISKAKGASGVTIRVWAYDYGKCLVKWRHEGELSSDSVLSDRGDVIGRRFHIKVPESEDHVILNISGRNQTSEPQILVDRILASSSPFDPLKRWKAGFWIWGVLTGIWWYFLRRRHWWVFPGGIGLWCAALLLILVGASLRLELLSTYNGVPLDPDAVAYMNYAEKLRFFDSDSGFYSASFSEREPLWIALLKVWQDFVGNGPMSVRLLSCLFSVAVIPLSGLLLWRFVKNWLWTVVGVAIIAVNNGLIEEAVRGLRSEAITVGFILFLLVTFRERHRSWHLILGGLMGGVLALLQSPLLAVVLGTWFWLWLLSFLRKRFQLGITVHGSYRFNNILLMIAVSLAVFSPHLYGFQKRYGDWKWPTTLYARWNANMEFQERLGQSGFPTAEEFRRNPYAGPPLSYREYLFGLHTPLQLIKYQGMGWVELSAYQALSISSQSLRLATEIAGRHFSGLMGSISLSLAVGIFLGFLAIVGSFRLLVNRSLWWVPLMLLWGTSYVAFLYHLRLVEPLRHTMHTYPLFTLIAIWGSRWICEGLAIERRLGHVWNRWIHKR